MRETFDQTLARINAYTVTPDEFIDAVVQHDNENPGNLAELGDQLIRKYPHDQQKVGAILARVTALSTMINQGLPGVTYDPDLGNASIPVALMAAAATTPLCSMKFGVAFDRDQLLCESLRFASTQGRA